MRGCDTILEYFIAGMVFISIVSPLLEEIATVFVQGLQVVNGFFKIIVVGQSLKIEKIKNEILKIADDEEPTRTIGFSADSEEEED